MNLFQFTPALKPDPLQRERALCEEWQNRQKEVFGKLLLRPLKRITLVGALYDSDRAELHKHDHYFLASAIEQCGMQNIPVSPRFVATPLNIAKANEQDFLDPNLHLPADIVVLCYIFNPCWFSGADEPASERHIVSPRHQGAHAWRDAAVRCGAKVVVSFGSGTEVSVEEHFASHQAQKSMFHRLVPSGGGRYEHWELGITVSPSLYKKRVAAHEPISL